MIPDCFLDSSKSFHSPYFISYVVCFFLQMMFFRQAPYSYSVPHPIRLSVFEEYKGINLLTFNLPGLLSTIYFEEVVQAPVLQPLLQQTVSK